MSTKRIVIIGAGGHGKVVCEAILKSKQYDIIGFVDASIPVGEEIYAGIKVILTQNELSKISEIADFFIVAIGNNAIRNEIFSQLSISVSPATIIHPEAVVATDVKIEAGTVVLAKSVISAGAKVGKNSIVNAGSIIDHDVVIGNNVHLSIGSLIGSNSKVKDFSTTQLGFVLQPFAEF